MLEYPIMLYSAASCCNRLVHLTLVAVRRERKMASIFTPEVGLLFDKQPITSGTAMADLDRLHHQCLNFGRAFTARRLQRSETVFNIIHGLFNFDLYVNQKDHSLTISCSARSLYRLFASTSYPKNNYSEYTKISSSKL